MKKIPLTQGFFALVDDEDFEFLMQWKWFVSKKKNQFVAEGNAGTPKKRIKMHRFILGIYDPSKKVDHINGDTLDNRRLNIRICTHAENSRNRGLAKNNTSGFKGVNWSKPYNKWEVRIKLNDKSIAIGRFSNLKAAAKAYNEAAKKYHGEFARLNEIKE
jgi:hypothetical protein